MGELVNGKARALLAACIAAGASLAVLQRLRRRRRSVRQGPPFRHVPGIPFVGVLPYLEGGRAIVRRFEEWASVHGQEGVYEVNIAGRRTVVVCSHELAQVVYSRRPFRVRRSLSFNRIADILEGTFTAEGDTWRVHRRLTAPAFNAANVTGYFPAVEGVVQELVERLGQDVEAGRRTDVTALSAAFAIDVIAKVAFGRSFGALRGSCGDGARAASLVELFMEAIMSRVVALCEWWTWPLLRGLDSAPGVSRALDEVIADMCSAGRGSGSDAAKDGVPSQTVLSKLLDVEGEKLTWWQVLGNMKTLFVAGVDTTTATISWMMYHLACDPKWQHRVAAEVSEVAGNRPLTDMQQLERLHATRAVYTETLRLRSAAPWLLLCTAEPLVLAGRTVPEGTDIAVLTRYAQDRHIERSLPGCPDLSGFHPERWLDGSGCFRTGGALEVVAFGAGARSCLGRRLADLEGLLAAAEVLRQFTVSGADAAVGEVTKLTQGPDRAVQLRFARRAAAAAA